MKEILKQEIEAAFAKMIYAIEIDDLNAAEEYDKIIKDLQKTLSELK